MMWTPVQLPPHPSSVQSLTPTAQKVLDMIRDKGNITGHQSVPSSKPHENKTPSHGRNEVTTDAIFDDHTFRNKNWSFQFSQHRQDDQESSITGERIMFDSFPSSTVASELSFQKNNYHSKFKIHTSKIVPKTVDFRNYFNTEVDMPIVTEATDVCGQLSPDMEFDNINIYSQPFVQSQSRQDSGMFQVDRLQSSLRSVFDHRTLTSHQRSIDFKEIKRYPYQKTTELSKMVPTDQTFIFANMPKKASFESKLNKYRVSNQKKPKNTKITSYFKPLEESINIVENLDEKTTEKQKTYNIRSIQNKEETDETKQSNEQEKEIKELCNTNSKPLIGNPVFNYLIDERAHVNSTKNKINHLLMPSYGEDADYGESTKTKEESDVAISLSEPIESLFVNTQDIVAQRKNEKNIKKPNELKEEFSIKSYQIQDINAQQSYDFEVDDLFSCDNDTETTVAHQTNLHHSSKLNKSNKIQEFEEKLSNITDRNQQSESKNTNTDNTILPKQEIYVYDGDLTVSQHNNKKQNGFDVNFFSKPKAEYSSSKNSKLQTQEKDQSSIQLNFQISEEKLTTDSKNLKQSNLNCWKMNVPLPGTNTSLIKHDEMKEDTENVAEYASFKKPQEKLEFNVKRSFNEQSSTAYYKHLKKPKYELNDSKLLQSNNNTEKLIQTTLPKSETTKIKTKNKSRFVAPILSHQTPQVSTDNDLQKYNIMLLDQVNSKEILKKLKEEVPQKVLITVTFKEGYTLLNKPTEPVKKSRCLPSGLMFSVHWSSDHNFYYWLPLLNDNSTNTSFQDTIHFLLSRPKQVVCFESQAVFMLLKDVFHFNNISDWFAHDPLIGCWLLDPDNPPKDFTEVAQQLQMDKNLLTISAREDPKIQACNLFPALDKAMDLLKEKLLNLSLWTVFNEMETKLTPLLASMECSSIFIDVKKLHDSAEVLNKIVKQLEKEAHQLAGHHFQLNSHKQLREILFNELKLDEKFNVTVKQTEHGSKSTSEAVLSQLKDFHPLPNTVLEYRRLQKVKSTYVDGLIQHVKPDNTISTTWEQVGAATGRLTSKNPNLQTIPKTPVVLKDGEKIHLRAVFKAREGFSFLAADFQQIEFRVFAHFTQDSKLLQAFQDGGDIFQQLAAQWLGDEGEHQREKTKRIVYSIMYGAGPLLLREYLHVDLSEAAHIIKNFTDIFPSLRSLPQKVVAQCQTQGYVVTLSGRRRLFPNIRSPNRKLRSYSERQAVNFLIQGSAADICKAAMLDCDTAIRKAGLNAQLLLQIHDELVWEVTDHHLLQTARAVREAMEHRWEERLGLLVPVPVSMSSGKTLADMKPLTE